jgi:hypothetical protein
VIFSDCRRQAKDYFGACGCQLKHWKTRRKRNKNFALDNIPVASFVEDPELFIASLRFAGFALEH